MLTKHIEKNLVDNCTRMLWDVLNKSLKQHPTKQQLYGYLPPISKTIQVRWTSHAGHSCKSKEELISNIDLWSSSHRPANVGWPARNYLQQLSAVPGCSLDELPDAMDDRDEWCGRVREIHASVMTWGWW